MSDKPLADLTREDKQPIDWGFLREMAVMVAGAMFVAGVLTAVGMLVLNAAFRIESSVAVIEITDAQGEPLSGDEKQQVMYDIVDPKRLTPLVQTIQNVNPTWAEQFPTVEAAVEDLRSRILIITGPNLNLVNVQLSGRAPLKVQTYLDMLLIKVQQKPVLEDPTVSKVTGPMPEVRVELVKSPSVPQLVFPRLIPIGVILFIVFMPIFPAVMMMLRKLRGQPDAA